MSKQSNSQVIDYLIVVDQHVRQMFRSSVLDRLGFRLLGITVMRCEPYFGWIIHAKMLSYSLHDIIIAVKF
jgi:hypothetical protein